MIKEPPLCVTFGHIMLIVSKPRMVFAVPQSTTWKEAHARIKRENAMKRAFLISYPETGDFFFLPFLSHSYLLLCQLLCTLAYAFASLRSKAFTSKRLMKMHIIMMYLYRVDLFDGSKVSHLSGWNAHLWMCQMQNAPNYWGCDRVQGESIR